MRILMLGWEFPPFFAGGLGTACHGLTRGLTALKHEVVFVLPKAVGEHRTSHVTLLGRDDVPSQDAVEGHDAPEAPSAPATVAPDIGSVPPPQSAPVPAPAPTDAREPSLPGMAREITPESLGLSGVHRLPASFFSPYPGAGVADVLEGATFDQPRSAESLTEQAAARASWDSGPLSILGEHRPRTPHELLRAAVRVAHERDSTDHGSMYGGDLFSDADRYAAQVLALGLMERFDVIHAHDWLTYPAGELLARATGKPLVMHIHATEFDRSGETVNQRVYDMERRGFHAADRIVAVSKLTKAIVTSRYGVPEDKVTVVYNGMENDANQPAPGARIESRDKIVLFLGRITMQKGPEYFIQAAKRVLEKEPDTKFVVAGSGDMASRMIDMAAALGIGQKVFFTGFLRGRDVDRVFQMADCFIMPSVSEPFGLVALEAMKHDTPVIISNQSGVSEVVTHALKVDFWDVDEMANKIVAVLKYPPLSQTLRQHGPMELRRLTWDEAAQNCVDVYRHTIMQRS